MRLAISLLAPPRCSVCAGCCRPGEVLCETCETSVEASRSSEFALAGFDLAVAAAVYDGAARGLVQALKFGARLALARRAATAIACALPPTPADARVVPVPPAPRRLRRRGFDPTDAIAAALATELGLPFEPCLARSDGPRQVGRRRRERVEDPPQVRLTAAPPERVIVVDDVLTTGATLTACARVLRAGGCRTLLGATFARSL
jgi:ComF family protein